MTFKVKMLTAALVSGNPEWCGVRTVALVSVRQRKLTSAKFLHGAQDTAFVLSHRRLAWFESHADPVGCGFGKDDGIILMCI